MGNVVVTAFTSLDGVVEGPGGGEEFEHVGWSFEFDRGADGDKFKIDELMASDAQLLGRVTYEIYASAWPSMTDEFAQKMNSMPKYVVSTTLSDGDADWNNTTVIRNDIAGATARLRQQYEGDILIGGSPTLVRTLAEHDLIDEYRLMQFPIVLGTGKRMFLDHSPKHKLRLTESRTLGPDGVILLTYQPAG
jgi:dihydrofolate reductase